MKSFIVLACVLATAVARPEAGYSYSAPQSSSHSHGSASGSAPITSYSPPASGSSFSQSPTLQFSPPAPAPAPQFSALPPAPVQQFVAPPPPVQHAAPAPQYLAPAQQAPIRSSPTAQYLAPAVQYGTPIETVPAPQYLAPAQDTTPYIANHGSSNFAFSSGSSGASSKVSFQSTNYGNKANILILR